ncbi:hypothetical protein hamaS1_31310 [Moorella sp. Hama-1]|nr:hypothetical protein hamaS1_31310 [Moorella sp. Hama-1]
MVPDEEATLGNQLDGVLLAQIVGLGSPNLYQYVLLQAMHILSGFYGVLRAYNSPEKTDLLFIFNDNLTILVAIYTCRGSHSL